MRKRHNSSKRTQQPSERGRHDNPLARYGHEGFTVDGRSSNGVPVSTVGCRKFAVQIHCLPSRYVLSKSVSLNYMFRKNFNLNN